MCTPNDDYETIATTSGCAIADVEVKCVDQDNQVGACWGARRDIGKGL